MKKVIKNNYKFILGLILGLIISVTTVYAVESYIESNKVTYNNHNKVNVQEALDELYEKSGIHQNKWTDPILNGADPVLKSPLIPVEIKNNGDVYYANENSEWYNYKEKKWANAVILIDNPSNPNYKVGDHIKEDDIESYFVWIPRYQYKVWDLGKYNSVIKFSDLKDSTDDDNTSIHNMFGNPRIIDIKFGDIKTNPKMSEPTTTEVYYTHPAFTLGDKDLNGLWVGKFETGYKGATDVASSQVNNIASDKISIKPGIFSWRGLTIRNMFMSAYNYKRNLNSHMLKNTEWGAIIYLSHSAYGIGGKVNINNNSDYKTGYSAAANTDQSSRFGETGNTEEFTLPYNTEVGYLASTTGNITGIYDTSGAGFEYMAACIDKTPGSSGFSLSELEEYMNNGYINRYNTSNNETSYNNRILGDAIGEIGPFYIYNDKDKTYRIHNSWYPDHAHFISSYSPWLTRGGVYEDGSVGSPFSFGCLGGNLDNRGSFHIAFAIN